MISIHRLRSLRMRLLFWLLVPLVGYAVLSGWISYQSATQTAGLLQDNSLLMSARIIIEDVDWKDGELIADIPPAALEVFDSPYHDRVFYQVVTGSGRLLGGTPDLGMPLGHPDSNGQPLYYHIEHAGQSLRAAAIVRQLYDSGTAEKVIVIVAKTEQSRAAMLRDLLHPQLVRQWIMLALVVILIPLGLAAELRPLIRLRDDVMDRDPMQLEPVRADTHLPSELGPIVEAINQCIARLKLHVAMQRQFIADAAHQLRTPLTLLDTQIQYAGHTCAIESDTAHALHAMRRTSRMMAAMSTQLLTLAQAESASVAIAQSKVDLSAVVADVFEEMVAAAERRHIDLGAHLAEPAWVTGNHNLLMSLVSNLVDNAIRYVHEHGSVTISCRRDGEHMLLQVLDNGPGIPRQVRAHVFERFYRAAPHVEGSGLGLSIVQEIARAHDATVALAAGPDGRGLKVTVTLQAWQERSDI